MNIVDVNGTTRTVTSAAPDPQNPGYIQLKFNNHVEWMTTTEFAEMNPTLSTIATDGTRALDTLGVVTTSTALTLTDTKAAWEDNAYLDYTVWIARGQGEGQQRQIAANTKDTLTLKEAWDILPDHFSQYVISAHLKALPARGNTLPQADVYELAEESKKIDQARGIVRPDTYYHPLPAPDHTVTSNR